MTITQQFLALVLVMFGAGCADDMPVTTHYVPADCPPTTTAAPPDAPLDEVDDADEPFPEVDEAEHAEHAEPEPKSTASATTRVDLNSASAADLTTLPGVGPALAARIIAYRDKRAFEKADDLMRVRGIGPAKFAKLKDGISVGKARQKRTP